MGKSSSGRDNSSVKKIFVLLAISGLYFFTLHPLVSLAIETQVLDQIREGSSESSNTLEPVTALNREYQVEFSQFTIDEGPGYYLNNSGGIITADPRILAMQNFLIDYSSPMYSYADVFIYEADKYGLDWRLVASISGVESAFGRLIPQGSNNGWGWKGDPTRDWSYFTTWGDGIATVTKGLALGYGTTLTPFQIEPTYCPPCGQNPQHAWANGVQNYMYELEYYLDEVKTN